MPVTIKLDYPADAVAQVTLDRPAALNAFNRAMRLELADALARLSNEAGVRVIVITGAGRGFSAGADVTDISAERNVEDQLNLEYGAFLTIIQTTEKPVVAAVNGPAAGIGMTLALTCDLRVMAQDAYMLSAFSNIGLVPDGGLSFLLTREIGYARAFQLALEAERLNAERCLALGLVNKVIATEKVVDEAISWAGSLARRAPLAMGATKRAFRAAAHDGLRNAMALEASLQRRLVGTADCLEGVTALMQKRAPKFEGR